MTDNPAPNPYAAPGDDALAEGETPPTALAVHESELGRKLGRWLLVAGGAQLLAEILMLVSSIASGDFELFDLAMAAVVALFPVAEIVAGLRLGGLGSGPRDLAELVAGIDWLRWAFVLRVLAWCVALGLFALEAWAVYEFVREGGVELLMEESLESLESE